MNPTYSILFFLSLFLFSETSQAQLKCKTTKDVQGETIICYHANGKKSTVILKDSKEYHWSKLKVYDNVGNEIYSKEYGYKWGSSGVDLKYYPNGQVQSARYTMQPDGGIQHYDVKTVFKEDGKFDHEEDNSWGNDGLRHVTTPPYTQTPPVRVEPTKPEVKKPNECAPVQTQFDFYIINNTSDEIEITCNNTATFGKPVKRIADSGDTVLIESYYAQPGLPSPLAIFRISLKDDPKKGYRFQIKHIAGSQERKQYVAISLRRIKK